MFDDAALAREAGNIFKQLGGKFSPNGVLETTLSDHTEVGQ
jgi:hypothetical protein